MCGSWWRAGVAAAGAVLLGCLSACGGDEQAPASFADGAGSVQMAIAPASDPASRQFVGVSRGQCVIVTSPGGPLVLAVQECPQPFYAVVNETSAAVIGTLASDPPLTKTVGVNLLVPFVPGR